MLQKVVDLGDGYRVCATRKQVGTFQIIGVDWEHPNYGFFMDAMVWIKSMHLEKWRPLPIVDWSRKYKTKERFLKDYPDFCPLFAVDLDEDEGSCSCQI